MQADLRPIRRDSIGVRATFIAVEVQRSAKNYIKHNNFKIAILTYRALQSGIPSYLSPPVELSTLPHSVFCTFLLPLWPLAEKLSDSMLQQFGILYLSEPDHYHLLTPSNVA